MSTMTAVNPATGTRAAEHPVMGSAEVEARLARAERTAREWARVPVRERLAVVRRVGELLDRDRDRHAALMTSEMGKLIGAAGDEVAKCSHCCRWYADHAESLLAPEPVEVEGERSWVAYDPLGPVLAIMPWNFPFWQVVRFAAPALCAGNVVLLKHASNVPGCALALEALFAEAGAPAGVFQALL
ncbi:MAG TPA: aldehyde dehydrogenase family protein, partial [Gemmatimonadaceae bacterium]|nr:aldehyde dehydrogenase family protein [Gemmatimonadaceae bacterium]